ncbi:MAG: DUF4203 domain-containing protein [Chloroflexi bacterium]|jgi:hypothetical protein|nr:DUF4203 domain-containing protein [Chloroflexota bacterium]
METGINLLAGALLLLTGRRLFWLFVAAVGAVVAFTFASQTFSDLAPIILIVIALIAALIGAVLALILQRLAAGFAGFLAGGYIATGLLNFIGFNVEGSSWLPFLLGGIIGGVLVLVLFDWALIVLSSLVGAILITQNAALSQTAATLLLLVLILVGIAVQGATLLRSENAGMEA